MQAILVLWYYYIVTVVIIALGRVNNHSTLSNRYYIIILYCIIYLYYTPWPRRSAVVRVCRSYFYFTTFDREHTPTVENIRVGIFFFSPRPACDLRIPFVRISFIVLHVELFDLCSSGAVLMDFSMNRFHRRSL